MQKNTIANIYIAMNTFMHTPNECVHVYVCVCNCVFLHVSVLCGLREVKGLRINVKIYSSKSADRLLRSDLQK